MSIGSLGQRIMVKLVNKLGGVNAASRALGIGPGVIMQFIEGKRQVPDSILLKAVDYVLDGFPPSQPTAVLPQTPKPDKPVN